MNRAIKWILLGAGALAVLVIAALLIIPAFVDLNEFKPQIEAKVSELTGRPFSLGGNIDLSLFPWAGIGISDLHLGNPSGFKEKDFVYVKAFEVRVKLLPLLFKDVQVKRFVLDTPRIVLLKTAQGQTSWEGLGQDHPTQAQPSAAPSSDPFQIPIKALTVGEFSVRNGSLLWMDEASAKQTNITDLNLSLADVSLERPIQLNFSAQLDGKPIIAKGKAGPIGKEIGRTPIAFDLLVSFIKELTLKLNGNIQNPAQRPQFNLALAVEPFSPRRLIKALGSDFPVNTTDPQALSKVAFKANIKGTPANVNVENGQIDLDDSKIDLTVKAKDFDKPNVVFNLQLDQIDVDRYLPPPAKEPSAAAEKPAGAPAPQDKPTDYSPLRKPVVDGRVRIQALKIKGVRVQDVLLKVKGKNGLWHIDPFNCKVFQGTVASKAELDVQQDTPKTGTQVQLRNIQAGPLLRDLARKDIIEGTLKGDIVLDMKGDAPDMIKRTLNGRGELLFKDGAIKGFDLAAMARNVKSAFGATREGKQRPRTDFSELMLPFSISNGLAKTSDTRLLSPFLRVTAAGEADLVKETLNFRVKPKFVITLKGQDDHKSRTGLTVPVIVSGTFTQPSFRPDLKDMLESTIKQGLKDPEQLQKQLQQIGKDPDKAVKSLQKGAQDLLKNLPFGKSN